MRQAPTPYGWIPRSWALLLGLCLLALTLAPVASAAVQSGGEPAVICMADPRQGRVMDGEGFIGNGSGADHGDHCDPTLPRNPAMRELLPPHADGSPSFRKDGSSRAGATDPLPGESGGTGSGDDATQDGTAGVPATPGILPWIIGLLVLLAVVLAILALLPRKDRSHR